MWDRRAQLVRVKDGDTQVYLLDQGFRDTKEIDGRLFGVWAPDEGDLGYKETTQHAANALAEHNNGSKWPFIVHTIRMKTVDKEQKTIDRYVIVVYSADMSWNLNTDVEQWRKDQGYPGGIGS